MMKYLRRNLLHFMALQVELTVTKIISSRQVPFETEETDLLILVKFHKIAELLQFPFPALQFLC